MKIKTFSFEDNILFIYDKNIDKNLVYKYGESCYIKKIEKIDNMINDFINNNEKNIEIIDIKINSIVKGNNPPTSILIYTMIYKECE